MKIKHLFSFLCFLGCFCAAQTADTAAVNHLVVSKDGKIYSVQGKGRNCTQQRKKNCKVKKRQCPRPGVKKPMII